MGYYKVKTSDFTRYPAEEDAHTRFWFESKPHAGKGSITVSLTRTNRFTGIDDGEIRVSLPGNSNNWFGIPTDMFSKLTAEHVLRIAVKHINNRFY